MIFVVRDVDADAAIAWKRLHLLGRKLLKQSVQFSFKVQAVRDVRMLVPSMFLIRASAARQ